MILGKYSLGWVDLKCTHWVHFRSTPPKLSSNWETENLPKLRIWCLTYIVITSTQLYNTNMRSSKLILTSNAKKQMIRFDYGRKSQDLKYFELYILEFIIQLRSSSNIYVENHFLTIICSISPFAHHFLDDIKYENVRCFPKELLDN